MSIFYKGIYKINLQHKAYINAIMQYNCKARIDEIILYKNGRKFGEKWQPSSPGLQLSHLQMKIENMLTTYGDGQEIEVTYRLADAWGMYNVLLPIKDSLKKDALKKKPTKKLEEITRYIEDLIFSETNIGEMGLLLPELPKLSLNHSEAKEVILRLSEVSQCIELPELNTIVFGSFKEKAAVFYLQYGDQFNIESMNYPSFDIDDGFVSKYGIPQSAKLVVAAMQDYYQAWKDRNYDDTIFPQELSLDFNAEMKHDMRTKSKDAPSIITHGHPLYQPKVLLNCKEERASEEAQSNKIEKHHSL